jgi:hypothetical protein
MFKLTIPPTQRELDYYKWEIWEPLREREDFEHEQFALHHDHEGNIRIPDPLEVKAFYEKWHLTAPFDPRMSFDDLLLSAKTRAKDIALGISEPRSRLAKAKRELDWIRDIKDFPNRLEIERARLKEIDELEQHIKLKEEEFQNLSDKKKKEMEKNLG